MGAIPLEKPVMCPECGGEGEVSSPIALVILGCADPGLTRCDLCHGLGRIEKCEADAWAREQDPTYGEDPAEVEANNRFHQWGR